MCNSILENERAELLRVLSSCWKDWPPKMRGRIFKYTLLVQRGNGTVLLFHSCLWSTEHNAISFPLFTSLRCTWMFYCLTLILLKDKGRVPDKKKWDLVDIQETLSCNMLITLFLFLLMSNTQAQNDLRQKKKKKITEGVQIKLVMYILPDHCESGLVKWVKSLWVVKHTKRSEPDRSLWGRRVLLQLLSRKAF